MKKLLHTLLFIFSACSVQRTSAQCTATLTASDDTICVYGNVVLQSAPTGMYDYQWFIDGQLGPLGMETWNYQPWWGDTGVHTFSVQITDFNNCTVISNTVTVVVQQEPSVQATGEGAYCLGSSAQLGVNTNNGTSFTWTGPNNFTSNLQNPVVTNFQPANIGTYSVLVSNGGCTWASSIELDTLSSVPGVNPYLVWGMSNHQCENEWILLDGTTSGLMNVTLQWSGPNNYTGGFITTTMADSGVYTLTATGTTCSSNTVTISDTLQLHVHPTPVVTATSNGPVCPGTTLQLSGTVSNATSYSWSGPNNFTSTSLNDAIPNMQMVNSGTYTLTALNNQCHAYVEVDGTVLTNNPSMDYWTDTGYVRCIGESSYIHIMNIYDINNPVVSITGPNNYFSNNIPWNDIPITSYADSGLYIIEITGTSNCGGQPVTISDSINVDVRPCVWPGDVNNDLITDNFDVLDLGLGYGTQGPVRPNADYTWTGQYMPDWGIMQFCGQDMKYADCNGNGILTASDTFGIALNYSQTHLKGAHIPQAKVTSNPDLFFDMTGITLTPGATVSIPIKLGTSTIPMVNVYGLAAQVKISGITPPTGLTVTAPAGWMGSIADALNFTKFISNDRTDWAYVRTDHTNASGEGTIAMLQFEVPAGSQYQQVQLWFDNVRIIGNTGNVITNVNILDDTATIYPTSIASGNVTTIINDAVVFPNPSQAEARLQISSLQSTSVQVIVTDVTGREIWSADKNVSKGINELQLPVSNIAAGMYTIQVKDERGSLAKTIKWVKN